MPGRGDRRSVAARRSSSASPPMRPTIDPRMPSGCRRGCSKPDHCEGRRTTDDGRRGRMLKVAGLALLFADVCWGGPPRSTERRRLFAIVEDRHGRGSAVVASLVPAAHWHGTIGNPALADAILDRLIHDGRRPSLGGDSMRKRTTTRRTLDAAGHVRPDEAFAQRCPPLRNRRSRSSETPALDAAQRCREISARLARYARGALFSSRFPRRCAVDTSCSPGSRSRAVRPRPALGRIEAHRTGSGPC